MKSAETGSQLGLWMQHTETISPHICFHTSFCRISSIQSERRSLCIFLLPTKSEMFTYLKVVLPCSYCSQLLILECSCFSFHTHYTRQCSPLPPSYLFFPISPLCCVVLPASPSLPYHLQWKSSGLIPAPVGFLPSIMMYICGIASEQSLLSAYTLLIPSVFGVRTQERQRFRMLCSRAEARDVAQNIRNDTRCLGIMLEIVFIYCASDSLDLVVYLPQGLHCSGTFCSCVRLHWGKILRASLSEILFHSLLIVERQINTECP